MPANPDTTRRPFALLATGLFSLASLTGVAACGDDDEGLIDDDVEGELDDVGDEVEDLVEDTGDAIEEETDDLPDETDDTDGQ